MGDTGLEPVTSALSGTKCDVRIGMSFVACTFLFESVIYVV